MKLAQVVWNFPSSVRAPFGMYYFYWPMREALTRGYMAEVLTFQRSPEQPHEEVMDGIHVRRFPLLGGRHASPAFIQAVLDTDADIIHTHGYGELQSEIAISLGRLRRRPVVYSPHINFYPWSRRLRRLYDQTVGLYSFRTADRVVVFTEFTRRHLIRLGVPPRQIAVVPHVARPDLFANPGAPAPSGTYLRAAGVTGCPIILGVGQLKRRKGWEYVVRCLPAIVRQHPEAVFVLLGVYRPSEPEFTDWLYALTAELGVRDHVVVLRDNPPELIRDGYCAATVMTHPSLVESFGIVLIEAMMSGLPVVAHDGTGLPEIVRHGVNGYTVDVQDTPAYTERLLELLGNEQLRCRMGSYGRTIALTDYGQKPIADRLFAVYDELLSGVTSGA